MNRTTVSTLGGLAILGLAAAPVTGNAQDAMAPDPAAVISNYADIALAGYEDSLTMARAVRAAVNAFVDYPSEESLLAAKEVWVAARAPYMQTEVYRFGNAIVDEWEGRVNAWPLDEGLIDYVDASYGLESDVNQFYNLNVIANTTLNIGGQTVDATAINADLLTSLHEVGGVEANVSIGYHAIEFLLWGQDLNGTGPGAGERPYTDYDLENCTGGNCDRRADYLRAAADLLVTDLEEMVDNWEEGGAAREAIVNDRMAGLRAIFTGLGSLSYGELAGERMKLGLLVHDPEEEHDCFADNTHNSHYYDVVGMLNVYHGRYERIDGSVVEGPSPADLVALVDAEVDAGLRAAFDATMDAMNELKERAETIEAYDQMLGEGNEEGNAVVDAAVNALVGQTAWIEQAIAALDLGNIELEGSDSLDNPEAVFQ